MLLNILSTSVSGKRRNILQKDTCTPDVGCDEEKVVPKCRIFLDNMCERNIYTTTRRNEVYILLR